MEGQNRSRPPIERHTNWQARAQDKTDPPAAPASTPPGLEKEESRRRNCLHTGHRTYALRDEAPVHVQYATLPMWQNNRNPDHHLIMEDPISGVCGRALSVYDEQELFMSWPAPSPPRFATGRESGAHCGAGPRCTFRYARTLLLMCDTVNCPVKQKYIPDDTEVFNDHTTSTTHVGPPRDSNQRPPPQGSRALQISYADEVRVAPPTA